MIISLIAAISENYVIGNDGDLPWHLPNDMKYFSKTTRGHHVLTGRKNFESIPPKYRPLPNRENIVITSNKSYVAEGCHVFNSIQEGIDFAKSSGERELFIIGGGKIYEQTIELADKLYITHVHTKLNGDTFFPSYDLTNWKAEKVMEHQADDTHNYAFTIMNYKRIN